jgi:DNA repair protein RadC
MREKFSRLPFYPMPAASLWFTVTLPEASPPSLEDIDITRKLVQCEEILGIKVIDHIIVSDDQHLSFAERKIGGL